MHTASSACATCSEPASASENTATEAMSSRRSVRSIRQAIAPRLAMSTFSSTADQDPHGRGIEAIARIVDLGTVGDDRDCIHQHLQIDVESRRGDAIDDAEGTVGFHRYVHEPVDVGDDVA